jgi:hypothetical protein
MSFVIDLARDHLSKGARLELRKGKLCDQFYIIPNSGPGFPVS